MRGESKLRSLETMKDDLKRFKEDGSNPKHAKHFNNVIDDIYFDIPLEQVKIKLLRQMKINMRSDSINKITYHNLFSSSRYILSVTKFFPD